MSSTSGSRVTEALLVSAPTSFVGVDRPEEKPPFGFPGVRGGPSGPTLCYNGSVDRALPGVAREPRNGSARPLDPPAWEPPGRGDLARILAGFPPDGGGDGLDAR